jgi:hypothetical protein
MASMIQTVMQRQVVYEASCHIGFTLTPEEQEALKAAEEAQAPEEEEAPADADAEEGGEQ